MFVDGVCLVKCFETGDTLALLYGTQESLQIHRRGGKKNLHGCSPLDYEFQRFDWPGQKRMGARQAPFRYLEIVFLRRYCAVTCGEWRRVCRYLKDEYGFFIGFIFLYTLLYFKKPVRLWRCTGSTVLLSILCSGICMGYASGTVTQETDAWPLAARFNLRNLSAISPDSARPETKTRASFQSYLWAVEKERENVMYVDYRVVNRHSGTAEWMPFYYELYTIRGIVNSQTWRSNESDKSVYLKDLGNISESLSFLDSSHSVCFFFFFCPNDGHRLRTNEMS